MSSTNIILKYLLLRIIDKKLDKKKFYLIIMTNLKFETLIIFNINIISKFDSMIY